MIQSELIPTTNNLSRISDTIAQIQQTVTEPGLVDTMVEQVTNGGSSSRITRGEIG